MLLNDLTTKVSNYNRRPMEKTYFRILLFLIFITSLSNSQDYEYDENYDYYNENYDDYRQEINDYYGNQNLLAPAPSPIPPPLPLLPTPPPPPPQPGNYIIVINFAENETCYIFIPIYYNSACRFPFMY